MDPIQDVLDDHPTMSDFLEIEAQVDDPEQRSRIIQSGFWDLQELQTKTPAFAEKVCKVLRHQRGNRRASAILVFTESVSCNLILWCSHTWTVQRALDCNEINQDRLERIHGWFETKKEAKDDNAVATFTDSCNKRDWAESVRTHFQRKLDPKGLPTQHVLRPEPAPLVIVVDQGWGNPSCDEELHERGRHDGANWAGNNRKVFDFLKDKTFGTTAWHTIKCFERSGGGKQAFLALIALYLGSDVMELLMKEAEAGLNTITFDGNSKNFDFAKYVAKLKQCFIDLDREVSDSYKIRKLMDSLNVSALGNIHPIIKGSEQCRNDFEATIVYIQDQLAALATKHAGKRSISFAKKKESTSEDDKEDKVTPWNKWTRGGRGS